MDLSLGEDLNEILMRIAPETEEEWQAEDGPKAGLDEGIAGGELLKEEQQMLLEAVVEPEEEIEDYKNLDMLGIQQLVIKEV